MYTGMANMKFESRILACLKYESWIFGPFRGLNPESLTPLFKGPWNAPFGAKITQDAYNGGIKELI